jgi:hypothetical protein
MDFIEVVSKETASFLFYFESILFFTIPHELIPGPFSPPAGGKKCDSLEYILRHNHKTLIYYLK